MSVSSIPRFFGGWKRRKNPHAHKNKIGTSTPSSKKNPTPPPPPKRRNLWAWRFSSRKNPKMPGAHKIGAAISGPRVTGGNFMDITLFLRREGESSHFWWVFLAFSRRQKKKKQGKEAQGVHRISDFSSWQLQITSQPKITVPLHTK